MDDDPQQPRAETAEGFADDETFVDEEARGQAVMTDGDDAAYGQAAAADGDDAAPGQAVMAGNPAEALGTLVAYLARNLVDEPDAVEVEARRQGNNVVVTLRVPETELGKVIGRQGRIARAVRTALTIAGSRYHVRASLDIEG